MNPYAPCGADGQSAWHPSLAMATGQGRFEPSRPGRQSSSLLQPAREISPREIVEVPTATREARPSMLAVKEHANATDRVVPDAVDVRPALLTVQPPLLLCRIAGVLDHEGGRGMRKDPNHYYGGPEAPPSQPASRPHSVLETPCNVCLRNDVMT